MKNKLIYFYIYFLILNKAQKNLNIIKLQPNMCSITQNMRKRTFFLFLNLKFKSQPSLVLLNFQVSKFILNTPFSTTALCTTPLFKKFSQKKRGKFA